MNEHGAEIDAPCCACSGLPVAFVIDGAFRKPVCEKHGRMYRQQGYRIEGASDPQPAPGPD